MIPVGSRNRRPGRVAKSDRRDQPQNVRCLFWPDEPCAPGRDRRLQNGQVSFQAEVWNLRRVLRHAIGSGADRQLMLDLNELAERRDDLERASVLWFDLIEILVQHEEQRFFPQPGRGAEKKAAVEQVLAAILRSRQFQLPEIPESLMPVVMDLAVDWAIDAVVLVTNRYGLWTTVSPPPASFKTRRNWIRDRTIQLLQSLDNVLASMQRSLSNAIRNLASSDITATVRVVRHEASIAREEYLIHELVNIGHRLRSRRSQLIATFEMVFEAVQEAEGQFQLSAQARKRYARDLVLETLDELGFSERTGVVYSVIDWFLDCTIEGAVHLFNKRGIFRHRRRRSLALRTNSPSRVRTSRFA